MTPTPQQQGFVSPFAFWEVILKSCGGKNAANLMFDMAQDDFPSVELSLTTQNKSCMSVLDMVRLTSWFYWGENHLKVSLLERDGQHGGTGSEAKKVFIETWSQFYHTITVTHLPMFQLFFWTVVIVAVDIPLPGNQFCLKTSRDPVSTKIHLPEMIEGTKSEQNLG